MLPVIENRLIAASMPWQRMFVDPRTALYRPQVSCLDRCAYKKTRCHPHQWSAPRLRDQQVEKQRGSQRQHLENM